MMPRELAKPFLGVSVTVSFELVDWVKVALTNVVDASSNVPDQKRKGEFALCLSWDIKHLLTSDVSDPWSLWTWDWILQH